MLIGDYLAYSFDGVVKSETFSAYLRWESRFCFDRSVEDVEERENDSFCDSIDFRSVGGDGG